MLAEYYRTTIDSFINPPNPEEDFLRTLGEMQCQKDNKYPKTFHFLDINGQVVFTIKETYKEHQEGSDYIVEALGVDGKPFATHTATSFNFGPSIGHDHLLFKIYAVAAKASRTSKEHV